MKDLDLLQSEAGIYYGTFNDLVIEDHNLKLIEGEEKLAQEITKIFLILKGSNILFKGYGTDIPNLINSRKIPLVDKQIRNQIIRALNYVKKANENESINIDEVQDSEVQDLPRSLIISLIIKLTNGELLTIKTDFAKGGDNT